MTARPGCPCSLLACGAQAWHVRCGALWMRLPSRLVLSVPLHSELTRAFAQQVLVLWLAVDFMRVHCAHRVRCAVTDLRAVRLPNRLRARVEKGRVTGGPGHQKCSPGNSTLAHQEVRSWKSSVRELLASKVLAHNCLLKYASILNGARSGAVSC